MCGLEVGSGELFPGDELTMTIAVDDAICSNGPLFSMAAMIGEELVYGAHCIPGISVGNNVKVRHDAIAFLRRCVMNLAYNHKA